MTDEARRRIENVVDELAARWHVGEHLQANRAAVVHMYEVSGVTLDAFLTLAAGAYAATAGRVPLPHAPMRFFLARLCDAVVNYHATMAALAEAERQMLGRLG